MMLEHYIKLTASELLVDLKINKREEEDDDSVEEEEEEQKLETHKLEVGLFLEF